MIERERSWAGIPPNVTRQHTIKTVGSGQEKPGLCADRKQPATAQLNKENPLLGERLEVCLTATLPVLGMTGGIPS